MYATGQIFQISKFPETLSFVIIPEMFLRNLTKIDQIDVRYKFAQSGCIPPKIKCEILVYKGHKQLAPHHGIISPHGTANQWNDGTSCSQWR